MRVTSKTLGVSVPSSQVTTRRPVTCSAATSLPVRVSRLPARSGLVSAVRLLGNREDAQDAAQEVFLRVHKYLSGFRSDQDFAAWLYRIIANVCRDHIRKRGHQQFASFESEMDTGTLEALASGEDVEANAIKSQQRAMIAEALYDAVERRLSIEMQQRAEAARGARVAWREHVEPTQPAQQHQSRTPWPDAGQRRQRAQRLTRRHRVQVRLA